jgi:HSP20 family molecular chaperone IbpA
MAFDDETDPFDDIFRSFFGGTPVRSRRSRVRVAGGEEETVSFVDDDNYVYLILELPGFLGNEISVDVDERIVVVRAKSRKIEGVQDYLKRRLSEGVELRKQLPTYASPKKFTHTFSNGVLEVTFSKK